MNTAEYNHLACKEYVQPNLLSCVYVKDIKMAFFNNILPGSVIADVGFGCCSGVKATFISKKKQVNVIGIDFSKQVIETCKKNVKNATTMPADMRKLPLQTNDVDGVYASFSLIHMDEQNGEKAIREFARMIKPGGWLFLATDIGSGKKRYFTRRSTTHHSAMSVMFHFWHPERLRTVLSQYGFRLEKKSITSPDNDGPDRIYLTCTLTGFDSEEKKTIMALGTSWRQNPLDVSLQLASSLKEFAGISRVSRIDRLCGFDIPVFSVSRPKSKISITVAGGKGTNEKESRASGLFEAIEIACAEADIKGYTATTDQLKKANVPFVEIKSLGADDNGA